MKKGDISFNTIVVALLAVLVLVVIVLVFSSQFRELMKPITDGIKNVVVNAGDIGK